MDTEHVNTPCVTVDLDRLQRNIRRMQDKADAQGIRLRPHLKTHKCAEIARIQLEHGACGLTVSRPAEAVFALHNGCPSVTVAYPLLSQAAVRMLINTAAEHGADLRCIADSAEGIAATAAAVAGTGTTVDVLLKIDTGLHRCGLREHDPRLPEYAQRIAGTPGLHFAGILSHAGHAYGAPDRAAVLRIAKEERGILLRTAERLAAEGLAVRDISAGATPTALADDSFAGLTELRPGNYVFLDGTQVRLGVCSRDDVALTVLASVISANSNYYIVDAGSKTLSSDLGAHGTAAVSSYGTAWPLGESLRDDNSLAVERLSEEHGFLRRSGPELRIGDRVHILPNHACPVVNLAASLHIVEGTRVVDVWSVGARNVH